MHANGDIRDVLLDSLAAAGTTFFGVLASVGVGLIKADPLGAALAAVIAGGSTFFTTLAAATRKKPSP